MFGRAFVAAGALHGLSEGAAQVLGHVAFSCTQSLRAPASAARAQAAPRRAGAALPRLLLNVCVVGDSGVGKSSLVYAYAGRAEQPEPTLKADFAYVDSRRRGVNASFAVWHLGSREEMHELGGGPFFSLASAFMLVYDPSRVDPAGSLDHWAREVAQQVATCAAEQWCLQHGVQHLTVRSPDDHATIEAAFAALESLALQRWTAGWRAGVSRRTEPGRGTPRASPAAWSVLKRRDLRAALEVLAPHVLASNKRVLCSPERRAAGA